MSHPDNLAAGFGAVQLHQAAPQMARSTKLRKLLREHFGPDRAKRMIRMMEAGTLEGPDGDEVHDYLENGISNDSVLAWETVSVSDYDGDPEYRWPIYVYRFHGVFQVHSPEYDRCGLFLSLDDAKSYVRFNWSIR